MFLSEIFVSREKGIHESRDAADLTPRGITGDYRGDGMLTLFFSRSGAVEADPDGLCTKRFVASLVLSLAQDEEIPEAGSVISLGDARRERFWRSYAELEILDRKKRCFPDCPLVRKEQSGSCPLRNGARFAKILESGRLAVGMTCRWASGQLWPVPRLKSGEAYA